jgi:hypothetical protein
VNNERRQLEAAERALMAKEEVVSMAIEQVTRSDTVLQAKLAALKRDRIKAEAGKLPVRCVFVHWIATVQHADDAARAVFQAWYAVMMIDAERSLYLCS